MARMTPGEYARAATKRIAVFLNQAVAIGAASKGTLVNPFAASFNLGSTQRVRCITPVASFTDLGSTGFLTFQGGGFALSDSTGAPRVFVPCQSAPFLAGGLGIAIAGNMDETPWLYPNDFIEQGAMITGGFNIGVVARIGNTDAAAHNVQVLCSAIVEFDDMIAAP